MSYHGHKGGGGGGGGGRRPKALIYGSQAGHGNASLTPRRQQRTTTTTTTTTSEIPSHSQTQSMRSGSVAPSTYSSYTAGTATTSNTGAAATAAPSTSRGGGGRGERGKREWSKYASNNTFGNPRGPRYQHHRTRSASRNPSTTTTTTTTFTSAAAPGAGRSARRWERERSVGAESLLSEATSARFRDVQSENAYQATEGEMDLDDATESWVTVVCEGKSVGRLVGVAAYQPSTGQVVLTELTDSQSYIKTTHTLCVRWPGIICVSGTPGPASGGHRVASLDPTASSSARIEDTLLIKTLSRTFGSRGRAGGRGNEEGGGEGADPRFLEGPGVPLVPIARRYFDANAGSEFIGQLILQDEETAAHLASMHGKYYALAAAAALFKYLEISKNWVFANKSLSIQYRPLEGTMLIDSESVKNLELLENVIDKRSKQSLYGFLNHCYTPMAQRLLRTSILAPLTEPSTINTRLEVVDELVQSDERFKVLRKALYRLDRLDADKLTGAVLSLTSLSPAERGKQRKQLDPAKESEKKIQLVLQLRTFIKQIPLIKAALEQEGGVKSTLLQTMKKVLDDERLKAIEDEIFETINDQALENMSKTAISARTSRVFAIRASRKLLLDVARETYKENIRDVDDLVSDLRLQHPGILDDICLAYSATAGFTITLSEDALAEQTNGTMELPRDLHKVAKRAKKVHFTCTELIKRNSRIQQSLDEVFLLSSDVLDELLVAIRANIAALYRCSEAIAMLDMLASFAHVATTSASYIRPEFTDTLAIKDGRHPVLERFNADGSFVPNDTYATEHHSFQLLTGPNMSGKTTFLKQVALLVVMSQIGCFVPAEYASFRIHDALLTRLSNDDSIEGNLSTFAMEMKTMNMILSTLSTCNSGLVIIDELGRGTSPQEGVGIAHAIAEEIIKTKSFCFFATHFLDLTSTLAMYPTVIPLHLETDSMPAASSRSEKEFGMTFTHRVRDGHTTTKNYGLQVAKVAALPRRMLDWAGEATERLGKLEEARRADAKGTRAAAKRKTVLETAGDLKQVFANNRLRERDLRAFVTRIINEAVIALTQDMDVAAEDEEVFREEAPFRMGEEPETMSRPSSPLEQHSDMDETDSGVDVRSSSAAAALREDNHHSPSEPGTDDIESSSDLCILDAVPHDSYKDSEGYESERSHDAETNERDGAQSDRDGLEAAHEEDEPEMLGSEGASDNEDSASSISRTRAHSQANTAPWLDNDIFADEGILPKSDFKNLQIPELDEVGRAAEAGDQSSSDMEEETDDEAAVLAEDTLADEPTELQLHEEGVEAIQTLSPIITPESSIASGNPAYPLPDLHLPEPPSDGGDMLEEDPAFTSPASVKASKSYAIYSERYSSEPESVDSEADTEPADEEEIAQSLLKSNADRDAYDAASSIQDAPSGIAMHED